MSPDKLYDYLDGKLPPDERTKIEHRLSIDPDLQRQLSRAREIHRGMQGSDAALENGDDQRRAGKLGRRIATIFAGLVLLNVVVGFVFIIGHGRTGKTPPPAQDAALRQQLTSSVEQQVNAALPPPTLGDEITLSALPAEREAVADKVVAAAVQCGGSGAKALPNEKTATVIVELPENRERDFRQALAPLGEMTAPPLPNESAAGSSKKLLQVQIRNRTAAQKQ